MSEKQLSGVKIQNGIVYFTQFDHEIQGYELNQDNPAHCLHLGSYDGEKVNIAIYPDSISILPDGKDGFCIKLSNKLNFKVREQNTNLPDPEKEGKLFKQKEVLYAVKMDRDFQVTNGSHIENGEKGDYLVKNEQGKLHIYSAERFEQYYTDQQDIPAQESGEVGK